jgi:hypothetical protein
MNFSELLEKKTIQRDILKESYNLPKRSKILVGVCFNDIKSTKKILDGLAVLPANFIIFNTEIEKHEAKNIVFEADYKSIDMNGLDGILCSCDDIVLERVMELGVVPLVNEGNYLGKILTEFHPGRAEGNAYLYEKGSYWSAYYALIRYLENHKFPYDNRNLVKNVS